MIKNNNYLTNDEVLSRLRDAATRFPTQAALANDIGISETYLSLVLRGRAQITDTIAIYFGYRGERVFFEKTNE